jgi:hypothetical protein
VTHPLLPLSYEYLMACPQTGHGQAIVVVRHEGYFRMLAVSMPSSSQFEAAAFSTKDFLDFPVFFSP